MPRVVPSSTTIRVSKGGPTILPKLLHMWQLEAEQKTPSHSHMTASVGTVSQTSFLVLLATVSQQMARSG